MSNSKAPTTETMVQAQHVTLGEEDISNFILNAQAAQMSKSQNIFTRDYVLSMSYVMSEFVDALKKIKEYPSQYQVELFRETCREKGLITALKDPYVTAALELKKAYDLGSVPWFDKVLDFGPGSKLELDDDPVITAFYDVAAAFLPELPAIEDDEYNDFLKKSVFSQRLINKGTITYEDIVTTLVTMRLPDRETISDIMLHLTSTRLITHWAKSYDLVSETSKSAPSDIFFGYFGSLAFKSLSPPEKNELMTWVSILIEPIIVTLEDTMPVSETARAALAEELTGIDYRLVHSSTEMRDPVFVVQAWAGNGCILVGMASASVLSEAESKAAGVALYKKSRLERARALIGQYDAFFGKSSGSISSATPDVLQSEANPAFTANVSTPYGLAHQVQATTPASTQILHGYPSRPVELPHQPIPAPFVNANYSSITTAPIEMLNKSEYQRQIEEYHDIILAEPVPDEQININSKAQLYAFLSERRYNAPEYKTSKLTNSDVQVIFYLDNVPLARATSTNKKKAGHIVARFVLDHIDYFLQKLQQTKREIR